MTGTVIRPDAVFNMQLLLGESETVYKGAYTLHKADGTTSSETAADGIIELKKDEWAEVKGLIGGNTIMVKEINLDTTEGYGYNAPAYTPAVQQFHLQPENDQVEIGGYPIVNIYANLQLKRTRLFAMYSHVNQGMGTRNSFLVPHYPINPSLLKIGVSWNFYD